MSLWDIILDREKMNMLRKVCIIFKQQISRKFVNLFSLNFVSTEYEDYDDFVSTLNDPMSFSSVGSKVIVATAYRKLK